MGNEEVIEEKLVDDRMLPALPRISWGAIIGGAFAALGIWALLYVFGLAVGLSSVDPNDPGSLKGSGVFAGIWGVLAPLVALFVGGFVAGRLAGVFVRGHGAIHGLIMWGLATVAGAYLVATMVSSVLAGAGKLAGDAASMVGQAVPGAAEKVDWDQVLGPVNQRLRAEGKPPLTAEQMQGTARDAIRAGMSSGRVDREVLERSLTQNTGLSRADVQDVAGRIQSQLDAAKSQVTTGALKATDTTGKAFWGVFGALALGLISALVGGALGVAMPSRHRRDGRPRTAEPPPRSPAPPIREVHPQH